MKGLIVAIIVYMMMATAYLQLWWIPAPDAIDWKEKMLAWFMLYPLVYLFQSEDEK